MSAPVVQRRGKALVWWGVALMVVAVLGGVIAVVGAVWRVGATIADVITADPQRTPVSIQVELDKGPYLIYELTGRSSSGDSWGMEPRRGVTVSASDVTVTAADGTHVPVGPVNGLTETITQGSLEYTGVARFDVLKDGNYLVKVSTPNTQILLAPSVVSGIRGSLGFVGLGALSGLIFLVGLVLLIVGIVRSRKPPVVATPPGWYQDPQGHGSWRWWDGNSWTDRTG